MGPSPLSSQRTAHPVGRTTVFHTPRSATTPSCCVWAASCLSATQGTPARSNARWHSRSRPRPSRMPGRTDGSSCNPSRRISSNNFSARQWPSGAVLDSTPVWATRALRRCWCHCASNTQSRPGKRKTPTVTGRPIPSSRPTRWTSSHQPSRPAPHRNHADRTGPGTATIGRSYPARDVGTSRHHHRSTT